MKFFCMYKPSDRMSAESGAPPSPEHLAKMGAFMEEMAKAGVLVDTGGLHPSSQGATVRLSNGKVTVSNGPIGEKKELVSGYAILQTNTKEEAIALTKRFLEVAGDGETELRQLYEPSDFGG